MTDSPFVLAITPTFGRHYYLERSVGMFLQQDYANKHMLIYQNCTDKHQTLSNDIPANVTLVNETIKRFNCLGELYTHIFDLICNQCVLPKCPDLIIFWDDDDIFFPEHISTHVRGILKHGKKSYKIEKSYLLAGTKALTTTNVIEPSWIIDANVIYETGFNINADARHHYSWIDYLYKHNEVYFDKETPPTFCYTWNNAERPIFKHSGNAGNPENMRNYKAASKDHGDGVITPMDKGLLMVLFDRIRSEA